MIHHQKTMQRITIGLLFLLLTGCNPTTSSVSSSTSSTETSSEFVLTPSSVDIVAILSSLPMDRKIGQMIQAERNYITASDAGRVSMGGAFSGGGRAPGNGSITSWTSTINSYQTIAMGNNSDFKIPLLYGSDGVHGNANFKGATLFPHNIGLGAANNPALMAKIGEITAREMRTIGMNMNFSPQIASVQDIRWGRTFESFSENPELVDVLSIPYITAMQENGVVATAKHYILDGATSWNDQKQQIDQQNSSVSMEVLRSTFLPSYKKAVDAGVKSIMVSYSSHLGIQMHGHKYLITEVLKEELGFKGIVVSDYNAILQLPGTYQERLVSSINAGIDLFLFANEWADSEIQTVQSTIATIKDAVNKGLIEGSRIDDAVTRILQVKKEMGLFERYIARSMEGSIIANKEARDVAQQAVRESLVLLKNEDAVLPLSKDQNILLIGPASNNLGYQNGGWSVNWQGSIENEDFVGTTLLNAFENKTNGRIYTRIHEASNADVVVVAIGEKPYAEYYGDNNSLTLSSKTAITGTSYQTDNIQALEAAYQTGLPVVVLLVTGRPLLIGDQLNSWDAAVATWWFGNEGSGITDVLYGDYDFKGKLPVTWPKTADQFDDSILMENYNTTDYQFPYGFGLTYKD